MHDGSLWYSSNSAKHMSENELTLAQDKCKSPQLCIHLVFSFCASSFQILGLHLTCWPYIGVMYLHHILSICDIVILSYAFIFQIGHNGTSNHLCEKHQGFAPTDHLQSESCHDFLFLVHACARTRGQRRQVRPPKPSRRFLVHINQNVAISYAQAYRQRCAK